MDTAEHVLAGYLDAVAPEQKALFDRLHRLIVDTEPAVSVTLSYKMPTYSLGQRRLYLGVWKHGVSLYGWREDHNGGFVTRHPELRSGKATIRIRPADAAKIADEEIRNLVRESFRS